MRNHGPFTIGKDARAAVKAAVMVEEVARTVHIARQLGEPAADRAVRHRLPLRPLPERLRPAPRRRRQPPPNRPREDTHDQALRRPRDLVPHREPGPLRRGDPARRSPTQSQEIARALDASSTCRSRSSGSPCSTTPTRSAAPRWRPTRDDAVHRRRSRGCTRSRPAKMWIAGLDALRKPLLHLHTQANVELPWDDIDFDFMNLNQAAHGDREFGYIQTRLGVAAQDRRRARVQPGRHRAGSAPGCARAAGWAATHELQAGPVRRQHAQRRGHRGRQDRGRAAVRRLGEHVGRERPRRGRRRRRGRRHRRARRRVRGALRRRPRAAQGRRPARLPALRRAPGDRAAQRSSRRSAPRRSPRTSRTSATCASSPASPSSGSWPTATASAPRATGRPRSSSARPR